MKNYLSLVKFSHTIFAMPFAMVGYFLAVNQEAYSFSWKILGLVVLCMVFARNAAMAFNRWADKEIDGKNPRTAVREIPAGILSADSVLIFVLINCGLFILTTYFINTKVFLLSPVALGIILIYSITKRYTYLCHLVLGLGLSLAPIGAYLAVTGEFDILPLLFSLAVMLWVAGFDVIYALQDIKFDKSEELNSIPVWLGDTKALMLSTGMHVVSGLCIILATYQVGMNYPHTGMLKWIGAGLFIILLIYQHRLVKPDDLSKVNLAFFTTNGIASLIFGVCLIADFYL